MRAWCSTTSPSPADVVALGAAAGHDEASVVEDGVVVVGLALLRDDQLDEEDTRGDLQQRVLGAAGRLKEGVANRGQHARFEHRDTEPVACVQL